MIVRGVVLLVSLLLPRYDALHTNTAARVSAERCVLFVELFHRTPNIYYGFHSMLPRYSGTVHNIRDKFIHSINYSGVVTRFL